MRLRARLWLLSLLALGQLTYAGECLAMRQAFLVQNSGWMEPFYTDPKSPLKTLVALTIEAVTDPEDGVFVLAFNQSTRDNASPALLHQGKGPVGAGQALASLGPAHKGQGTTLADTDFVEAVTKTISGTFAGQPGIIWIFTNNKNSPGNDKQTAARNRQFYELIHNQAAINRTLALPLSMPVKGNHYDANGLMVYALAYGEAADQHLQRLYGAGRLGKVFPLTPAQLKPLDKDPVRIASAAVPNAPGVTAALGRDGRTLVVDMDSNTSQPRLQIVALLENLFYPFEILSASLSASVAVPGCEASLGITPDSIEKLAPGNRVEARLLIPVDFPRPSPWSLSGLMQFGRSKAWPAVITIRLDNQRLALHGDFRKRMAEVFPGDPLPDAFTPPAEITASVAQIPLLIRVNYPLYPVLIALGLMLGLVFGGALLIVRRGLGKTFRVTVDGTPQNVSLACFSSRDIFSPSGERIATLKRGLGRPGVAMVVPPHDVRIDA